jgi:hypothetical protein
MRGGDAVFKDRLRVSLRSSCLVLNVAVEDGAKRKILRLLGALPSEGIAGPHRLSLISCFAMFFLPHVYSCHDVM